ncbi:MAG: hypothetical protein KC800_14605 [Candidatus Eremiobacteraeota bacterium]|nr:hypothetical protein [Candidatus Eremiobacteraeota bacterium]
MPTLIEDAATIKGVEGDSMFQNTIKAVTVFLACLLCLSGCGDSEDNFVITPGSSRFTTIELRSVLAQSVVPTQVVAFRGSGFNSQENRIYGPSDKNKSELVRWTLVPIEVTEFVIEYLNGDGTIVGEARVSLQLVADELFIIDNPTITFFNQPDPNLPNLTLRNGQTYDFNTDTGIISPAIDGSSTPPGWNAAGQDFTLNAFTMEAGSVLNVSGSAPFNLSAQSNITLDGTLAFVGANGIDGADIEVNNASSNLTPFQAEDGTDGTNGGDISLSSASQITGSGVIMANGGNGGDGGSVIISGINQANLTGGDGGNGGQPGEISLDDSDNTIPASIQLFSSGSGGNGGNVSTGLQHTVGTLRGGNGGNSAGSQGTGGNGGEARVMGSNTSGGVVIGGDGGLATGVGGFGGNGGNATVDLGSNGPTVSGGNGGDATQANGTGGNGGTALVVGNSSFITTLTGGDGGDATATGGQGGNGGNATVGGTNDGSAVGGTGGTGNPSPTNDGTNGTGTPTV